MNKEIAYRVIEYFNISGDVLNITPYGTGHIHDTFMVQTVRKKYILQKINHHVFKQVPVLMSNIARVTEYINQHYSKSNGLRTLTIVPARGNKSFYTGIRNDFWRLYEFIDGTSSFELPPNHGYAYEGGKAFGTFISSIVDLPGPRLHETIPDFHNIQYRLEEFNSALAGNDRDRLIESRKEIEFVHKNAPPLKRMYDLYRKGLIPERTTHNDTKFNNILFNRSGQAVCIVDLDTVMPGCLHFDFGDAIRIIASTAAEDEADLNKIVFNIEMYRAFTRGFLLPLKPLLAKKEIETLALAPLYMTFLIGLRFLTDYLRGDVYFKIEYPQQNWYRACAQFQLFACMMVKAEEMRKIIYESIEQKK